MTWKKVVLFLGLVGGSIAANACVWDAFGPDGDTCINPKWPAYTQPFCEEMRRSDTCQNKAREIYTEDFCVGYREDPESYIKVYMGGGKDAGASDASELDAAELDGGDSDAGADAGADASSGRIGRCGPAAPNDWSLPEPVWFGPIDQAPAVCPPKMGSFGGRDYSDLNDSKLEGCAECGCENIDATCSLAADTIFFQNAACGEVANAPPTPFGPFENWDGSCSKNHAIAADPNCAQGSGTSCIQALNVSGLLVSTEGCKPYTKLAPPSNTNILPWNTIALSCTSTPVSPSAALRAQFPGDKVDIYNTCVPGGEGWRTCIHPATSGSSPTECESGSLFSDKVVMYQADAYKDNRSCTACGCESGGACVGTLSIYEDDACLNLLAEEDLDSNGPLCDDLLPPDKAIGSKAVTDLHYESGSCNATGGKIQGNAEIDETKTVIWCCLTEESALYNIDLE